MFFVRGALRTPAITDVILKFVLGGINRFINGVLIGYRLSNANVRK